MVLRELKKMRDFLRTPVPYLAGFMGILVAVVVLSNPSDFMVPRLEDRLNPYNTVPVIEEGEPAFEFIFYCDPGYDAFAVLDGLTTGLIFTTSAPGFAATEFVMSGYVAIHPQISKTRFERTFAFTFLYFNFIVWLFAAFGVYSVHWEVTRETPISPMQTLGL